MEKNYVTMATEVEKLRAELSNAANVEGRAGITFGNLDYFFYHCFVRYLHVIII